jgi:glutathione S-transferase
MRAWLALRAAKFEFQEEVIDIRRPQRFPNLERIGRFAPPAAVPVLVVGDEVIFDSLAIMEFANDVSGGALLPADALARAAARSIVAWQHSGLSGICERISFESAFYPYQRALTPDEMGECHRLFRLLETTLQRSRGPHLFGAVSLADFALAPTVVRLTRHRVDLEDWPLTGKWAQTLLDHELVAEWLGAADELPHVWFDEYLHPALPLPGFSSNIDSGTAETRLG